MGIYINEKQYQKTLKKVIALIALDFPSTVEYNLVDNYTIDLLDRHNEIVGHMTTVELTHYWNRIEEL